MNQQTLARALSIIAMENGLKWKFDDIYTDGEFHYKQTPLGYVGAMQENYKQLYFELLDKHETNVLDHKNLKSNYGKLVTSQEVTTKQTKKVSEILNQKGRSDSDIIKDLKRYLKIK